KSNQFCLFRCICATKDRHYTEPTGHVNTTGNLFSGSAGPFPKTHPQIHYNLLKKISFISKN
ncbi:hypothetical protein, partial [Ferrovum myxofaciens]|uniref:hypothetical protein n=1 Tax=Ferrovum myxofaciens TaxID=416213 RepID=UPI0023572D05